MIALKSIHIEIAWGNMYTRLEIEGNLFQPLIYYHLSDIRFDCDS